MVNRLEEMENWLIGKRPPRWQLVLRDTVYGIDYDAKVDIDTLLAVAEAAAEWLRAKRRLNEYQEHGPLDIDTIYQLMTANRQAREAFWNAIAPLMEEVSDDNQA